MLNFERQQQNYLSMIENSLHLYLPEEGQGQDILFQAMAYSCLLYTSPSPRDA